MVVLRLTTVLQLQYLRPTLSYAPKGNSYSMNSIFLGLTTRNQRCRENKRQEQCYLKKETVRFDDGISGVAATETIHPSFVGVHGFIVLHRFLLFSTSFTLDRSHKGAKLSPIVDFHGVGFHFR
jgi:hypothetical protein